MLKEVAVIIELFTLSKFKSIAPTKAQVNFMNPLLLKSCTSTLL